MTQQLPPPPAGFTAQPTQSAQPQQPPPPQGFTAEPQRFGPDMVSEQSIPAQQGLSAAIQSASPVLGKMFTGAMGLGRRTDESQGATELIDAPVGGDIGFKIGFNLATNFDEQEIVDVIRKSLGADAIRTDDSGNTFVTANGKEYILNKPGLSKQDIGTALGNIIAFLPASRAAAIGQTVAKRLGLGALASGGTQAAIEGTQAATGGDIGAEDIKEIGMAAALGPLGEIPGAIQQTRRLTPDAARFLPEITPEQAATATRLRQQTGVSILPSQATGKEQDQLLDIILRREPATSGKVSTRLREQSADAHQAVTNMLDLLATSDDSAKAALDVRNTSKQAVDTAVLERTKRTAPLFKKVHENAIENKIIIDTSDIIDRLKATASQQVGGIKKQINSLISIIESGSKGVKPSRVIAGVESRQGNAPRFGFNSNSLQNSKKEIDRFIKKQKKDANINDFTLEVMNSAKNDINSKLIEQVPGFKEANDLFIELSPAVDKIKDAVGDISKIPDNKLASVRNKLFNWNEFTADEASIRAAKRVIKGANPDAWNAILRNKLKKDMAEVGVDSVEEALDTNVNFIQQFWSKALSGKDKAMMMQALDSDAKKNFNALSEVFSKSRIRPNQSATAQLAEMSQAMDGSKGVAKAMDAVLNPINPGIFQRVFGSEPVRQRNIQLLADVLMDPKWTDRLTEIRKLGMGTQRGGAAFVQLFRDALSEEQPVQQPTGTQQ